MYVTELANHTGVAPDTVRYYTKIGLLNPGGIRRTAITTTDTRTEVV